MLLCVHKIILIRRLWLENVYGDHFFLDTVYKTVITSSWLDKLTLLPANHWLVPRNLLTCLSLSAACLISSGFSDSYIKTLCVNKQLRQYDLQSTVWKSLLVMGKKRKQHKNCWRHFIGKFSAQIIIISGLHHYECVAPLVANSLQSGWFWARSTALVHDSPYKSRSFCTVFIQIFSFSGHPSGLFQYTEGEEVKICLALYCRPFGRYVWIGLDAMPG